ncbi:MAG: M48 family metallopeptidase [Bacteroidota bacterium]|nr:M48 family metallopeptidase [Bacteroidota bacterium]
MPRLLWLLLVLLPAFVFAQNPASKPNLDNYQPARANGPLPQEFLISTAEKAAKDNEKIDQSQDKKMKDAQVEFYLQTNYSVDQMRFSGEVLVNDTFSIYINRVADSLLLKQDPELRKKLKFYILRSPSVNAFTTDQGAIFVTVGLLTRLKNEAELAFVLAHEVIHYKRNHVLTGYVEGVKAREGLGQYDQTTFENRFLKRHRYSRAYESQADEEGFELLLNSNYDPRASIAAFDILALADAPFSDTLFEKSFFDSEYFAFPSKYYVDTIKQIKPEDEDEDDDLATHPSVFKRRKVIIRKFGKLGADTIGSKYLVSETMFWRIREMARFEEISEHTAVSEFGEAIYSNYVEQKIYPGNHYLSRELVRAMYGSVIKKNRLYNYNDLSALFESLFAASYEYDSKPIGEQGRLKAFVNKADATGWNVVALKFAWKAHTLFPEDKDLTMWTAGLFRELAMKNEISIDDFEKTDSAFIAIGNKAFADSTIAKKIKKDSPLARFQAGIDHLDRDSLDHVKYWHFAFVNELKDSAFVQMYRAAQMYADSIERSDSLWYELSSKEQKKIKNQRRDAYSEEQGMTSIVAVNPIYVSYDATGDNEEVNVKSSLEGHDLLIADMKESASALGLNLQILDRNNMDTGSVSRFNDLVTVNEWFDQRQDFGDNQILPYPQEQMKALAEKYGTQYFMWSAYQTYKSKRGGKFFRVLSLAVLPLAPHTLYRLFTPKEDVYYTVIIYDIVSGKPVFVQRTQMVNQKSTEARRKLHIFDLMRLLSDPKKIAK